MVDPTIGLKLPTTGDSPSHPDSMSAGAWGDRAEELGYDSIWMSEGWGHDVLISLAEIALRTETIRCCTAIVNTYSRTPPVLAMAGATLQHLSDGRAVLGVGPSHASTIETLHGLDYERPVRRTHETIELIKELTGSSDEITYHGDLFHVDNYPGFDTEVPVYNAALGEANRRATGRVADGWLPYLFPVSALNDAFDTIAGTARAAGRDPNTIDVAPQILAAVSDDPEEAKDPIRGYIATYIGKLPNYRQAVAQWYPEESDAIANAWNSDELEAAKAAVTDDLVSDLAVAGTPDTAQDQLAEIVDTSIVDCPIVYVPRSMSARGRDRTIEALKPANI